MYHSQYRSVRESAVKGLRHHMYRCRQRPGNVKAQSVCNDRFAVIVEEPRLRFERLVYDWKVNSHLKMIKKTNKQTCFQPTREQDSEPCVSDSPCALRLYIKERRSHHSIIICLKPEDECLCCFHPQKKLCIKGGGGGVDLTVKSHTHWLMTRD